MLFLGLNATNRRFWFQAFLPSVEVSTEVASRASTSSTSASEQKQVRVADHSMVRTDSKQKKLDAFMTSRLHDSDEVRRSVAVNHLSDAVFFFV